jgi:hypothetical protein
LRGELLLGETLSSALASMKSVGASVETQRVVEERPMEDLELAIDLAESSRFQFRSFRSGSIR